MKKESQSNHSFIPASESRWILFFFGWVVRWLFYSRFSQIEIVQNYRPGMKDRTIYVLNHTSWWDGILPLLLNQTRFKQQARAMMELKQMMKYRVFRYIGAFSVDLSSSRQTLRSLRYAVESMRRKQACLFIYPEGKINAPSDELPYFESGVGWIVKQCLYEGLNVDVVPISIYIHEMTASKPVLWVEIGAPVEISSLHLEREDNREKGDRSKREKERATDDGSISRIITQSIHSDLESQLKALKERAYIQAFG